jgi:hypothetical protein
MSEINPAALDEVAEAFERYRLAVQAASMSLAAKEAYLEYASAFVRWLQGEFNPAYILAEE